MVTFTRRELLKTGAVVGGVAAAWPASGALADLFLDEHLDSPPVPSFRVPIAFPRVLRPTRVVGNTDYYTIRQAPADVQILPGRPKTRMWAYNGSVPGPTIIQMQGRDVRVRQVNALGVPVSVHLHGGDIPADSDGHPLDLIQPGQSRDYYYPGRHAPANLWYHDHAIHETGRNVYMGLAGMYRCTDQEELDLPLPKGEYDLPLLIGDKFFLPDGQIAYPRHDEERPMRQGVFGDVILVNGRPKPFFSVGTRRYRFRALNRSNARVYRLRMANGMPFTIVATEGGFLAHPIQTQEIVLSPSERISFVLDFSRVRVGTTIVLRNTMSDVPGDPYDESRTREIMRFDVDRAESDRTSIPADLPMPADLPRVEDSVATRRWVFERKGGEWVINDKPWQDHRIDARPRLGTTEIWELENKSGGWWHPIHIHLIEFLTLSRTRRPLQPYEVGLKDTILLRDNEVARVAMRWNHHRGRYVMHCHNVEHEDHDMMTQFQVV